MGSCKDEKSRKVLRGVKTLFFLITMLASLLIFSAPVLLVIADTLLPSALLSAFLSPSLSLQSLSSHLKNYDFRYSLVDIPLISIVRSAVIFCVYCFCDGPRLSRGPYLGITTLCSLSSLAFVSLKASYVFESSRSEGYLRAMEVALFMCSLVLAVGHIVVAYRTSCRERRKLLIYKIDIEAEKNRNIQQNFNDRAGRTTLASQHTYTGFRLQEGDPHVPKASARRKSEVIRKWGIIYSLPPMTSITGRVTGPESSWSLVLTPQKPRRPSNCLDVGTILQYRPKKML